MTTPRKRAANARNAAKSTGPRTAAGKARSRMNAAAHGLRAASPVLPGEDPAAWEAFRAGVVADLDAVGPLEAELAGRVAALQWRLRRVTAFEAAVGHAPPPPGGYEPALPVAYHMYVCLRLKAALRTAELLDRAAADGPMAAADAVFVLGRAAAVVPRPGQRAARGARIDWDRGTAGLAVPPVDGPEFLGGPGVPADPAADPAAAPAEGAEWTAAAVRAGFARLAAAAGWTAERLAADARRLAAEEVAAAEAGLPVWGPEQAAAEAAARRPATVPTGAALEAVLRYEPQLSRQLAAAVAEFARVRGRRGSA